MKERQGVGGETLSASAALAESAADAAGTNVQSVRCEPSCSMFARLGGAARCLHDWVKLVYVFLLKQNYITTYIFTVQGVNRHRNFVGNTAEASWVVWKQRLSTVSAAA